MANAPSDHRELVQQLVELVGTLGRASFMVLDETCGAGPNEILLADCNGDVLATWQRPADPPRNIDVAYSRAANGEFRREEHESTPLPPVELDPAHIAETLAAILNAIARLDQS